MSKAEYNAAPVLRGEFTSDNIAGASPEIIAALADANRGMTSPYGADTCSARVEAKLREVFECELSVFLVPTGSAANALCLSAVTPPWGNIYCHPDSHINNDECGAPEFYSNGAKLVAIGGEDAKIDPLLLKAQLSRKVGDVHSTQPASVSITQATETGGVYDLAEIQTIGEICRQASVRLHMDGARFANALIALDCSPADMTWKAGVELLSFGATKNGVIAAEAIIVFDRSLADEMAYRRKRGGHLFSKMRFLAAQIEAYLENDLWLKNAAHANQMAARLKSGLERLEGVEFLGEARANIIFCKLPQSSITRLLEQGFSFYHDRWGKNVVRLVTSFATSAAEVDSFIDAVKALHAEI